MRLKPQCAALVLAGCLCAAGLAQDIVKFDFGPEDAPLAEGFARVSRGTVYGQGQGFGFRRPAAFEYDTARLRAPVALDDLSRDGVVHPRQFTVDLPDGEYGVALFTGTYTSVYVTGQLHRALNRPHWVRQGDEVLYERERDINSYYAPDGPYFASYDTFYRPGQSLWHRYVRRHLPVLRFDAVAEGGRLQLDFSDMFPVSAMLVWPADLREEGEALAAELDEARGAEFDARYVRAPLVVAPEPLAPSAEEERAGMVLFSRHAMSPVFPETVPRREEVGRALEGFAPRGSAVILQMSCLPLRDLGEVALVVGDLAGPGGTIPADAVDVRYARYVEVLHRDEKHYEVRPSLLTRQLRVPADAGVPRSFYLTVNVPHDAAPGIYQGRASMRALPGGEEASLAVRVRVLPFSLPEPIPSVGSYYSAPTNTRFRPFYNEGPDVEEDFLDLTRRNTEGMFRLLRGMGFNHVSTTADWRPFEVDEEGNISVRDRTFARFAMMGDAVRDAGLRDFSFFGIGWTMMLNYAPGFLSRTEAERLPVEEIRFPDSARVPTAALMRKLYDTAQERGWPEMVFYVSDELGNMGVRGRFYGRELAKFLQSIKPLVGHDVRLLASTLRFSISEDMLRHLDIIQPNHAWPVSAQTLEAARQAGPEVWLYNMGENRNSFGYYMWRIGAKGRVQWTLDWSSTGPDPYFGFGINLRHCTVDPELNGIPSRLWHVDYRGGVDDYRHVQLLEEKMRTHPDHPAAAQARDVLAELNSRLSLDYHDEVNTWRPGTFDYFRWKLSEAIMAFPEGR